MKQTVTAPPAPSGFASQPDPAKDQPGKPVPEGIAEVLLITRVLAAYGRHLAALIPQRGLWRGFSTVARFLDWLTLSDTVARIHRGILRAVALERVLLARAKRGRDLKVVDRRIHTTLCTPFDVPLPPDHQWHADPQAAEAPSDSPWQPGLEAEPQEPDAGPHYAEDVFAPDPACRRRRDGDERVAFRLEFLPSLAEMEKEVRRRPIGRTLALICLDLGISPKLCAGPFWNRLFHAMWDYGGNVGGTLWQLHQREVRFEKEDWKHPRPMPWPEQTREGVQRVLGFFIGEEPVDPFRPDALLYAAVPYPEVPGLASHSPVAPRLAAPRLAAHSPAPGPVAASGAGPPS